MEVLPCFVHYVSRSKKLRHVVVSSIVIEPSIWNINSTISQSLQTICIIFNTDMLQLAQQFIQTALTSVKGTFLPPIQCSFKSVIQVLKKHSTASGQYTVDWK